MPITDNINVIQEGEWIDQEVIVRAAQIVNQHKKFHNLANSDWVKAQQRDPVHSTCNYLDQPAEG